MNGYGPYLKAAIEREGLTYDELAKRLNKSNLSKTPVQNMANGKRPPRIEELNALAANLPISIERLLQEMGVRLYADELREVPTRLRPKLAGLTPEQWKVVEGLLDALARGERR